MRVYVKEIMHNLRLTTFITKCRHFDWSALQKSQQTLDIVGFKKAVCRSSVIFWHNISST